MIMTRIQWRRLRRVPGARAPTFTNGRAQGTVSRKTAKNKLTKTKLTKALTKRTNCTFIAKKVQGHDQTIFSGTLRRIGAPLSRGTGAPHF